MTKQKQSSTASSMSPALRALFAFVTPVFVGLVISQLINNYFVIEESSGLGVTAVILATLGITAWILGMVWYGVAGMGVRGGRPLFSGIGFAVLGWFAFLILRFVFVEIEGFGPANSARAYIYLFLFEALALQIWTFGLLFHTISDWRGPLTAAIVSGFVFGLAAAMLFQEIFYTTPMSIMYFIIWGVMYGIIRLRTGSLIGTAWVQSLQSFTTWVVIVPKNPIHPGQLQSLYMAAIVAFLIIIWRLWPKSEDDVRV